MKRENNCLDTLFCMSNLEDLGIQRVICWILNNWNERRLETSSVALSLNQCKGKLRSFLDPKIQTYELDTYSLPIPGLTFLKRVFSYVKLLKNLKPRKVIAVNQAEALALCLAKRFYPNFKLIVCEHCHVSSNINGADGHKGFFGWYYRTFFQREYARYADVIHTVSFESAEDLIESFGFPKEKVKVIYNPIDLDRVLEMSQEEVDEEWIVDDNIKVFLSASRLSSQKRLDILLNAWNLFLSKNDTRKANYKLIICGDGDEKAKLQKLSENLGISNDIKFLGFQSNPWKFIAKANFFVSTSEWEGLSCSLIEAQALGVPILASNCPSGNKEILMNGQAGFLFENKDVNGCAFCLEEIAALTEDEIRHKAKLALENINRFDINKIVNQYYEL